MESKFFTDAVFKGRTANAIKLGTILTLGRFWVRPSGCHTVYRGQDGIIDYNNIAGVMELDDTSVSLTAQDLPAGSIWHYIRRQVSECGLESPDSPPCVVIINSDGEMISSTPNTPANLKIEQVVGGKLRLRWRYIPTGQEIIPTGFAIYIDDGNGFNFDTPLATIPYKRAIEHSWTSEALTHGQRYKFIVRSYAGLQAHYAVSGDITPEDAKGDYFYSGMVPSSPDCPYYVSANENYTLVNAGGYSGIFIGTYDGLLAWIQVGEDFVGDYFPAEYGTGTATVTFVPSAGYSSNTNYVSAVADAEGPAAATGITLSWEADD